jgi:hypothetical protein
VGIDWATRRARWCAVTPAGVVIEEGWAPADEDGLAGLVMRLGPEASACMEMMSGAAWVRERLQAAGWTVQIADARKAKAVGSLAAQDRQARRAGAGRAGAPRPCAAGARADERVSDIPCKRLG